MAQYKIGSVNVTNGSATVTGVDTLWSSEISAGDIFTVVGDNAWYEVGSVGSNTSITLTSSYSGTTASGAQYAISRDFTTNKSIPYPQKGDIETASLLKRAMNIIDTELSTGFDSSNVTITGGTINGTTIGGTTAAAGAFTTLAASGAVTLSGGTANGVAYLNGSKVLTSGSALTFDPASRLNLVLASATATPTWNAVDAFRITGSSAGENYAIMQLHSGVASGSNGYAFAVGATRSIGGMFYDNSTNALLFTQNSAEGMRLTSTGLGIGTSSPAQKLQVANTTTYQFRLSDSTGAFYYDMGRDSATGDFKLVGNQLGSFVFGNGNGTLLTLNGSGNLGIGTSSPGYKLDVNGATQITSASGTNLRLYTASGAPLIQFYPNAAGGRAQTIYSTDSSSGLGGGLFVIEDTTSSNRLVFAGTSGNLGIGTSSPENKLTLVKNTTAATENTYGISVQSVNTNGYTELLLGASDAVDAGIIQTAAKNTNFTGKNLALQPQGGNVGIGTSSPSEKLDVQGNVRIGATKLLSSSPSAGNYNLTFQTYSGGFYDRMVLDYSGNLGIGTSSPSALLDVNSGGVTSYASPAANFLRNHGAQSYANLNGLQIYWNTSNGSGESEIVYGSLSTSYLRFIQNNAGTFTERMRLDSSGNLGLGVTPSAWASNRRVMEIGGNTVSAMSLTSAISEIYVNAYWNGTNNIYKNNGPAAWWNFNNQSSGGWAFNLAPSGTAGDAISFTQSMTLDASGNFMVGVTSTSYRMNATVQSGADRDVFAAQIAGASNGLTVKWNHATTTTRVNIANLPTSSAGLASGDLWNDSGTLKIA